MALPSTGQISLSQIQGEFGGTDPISITEYYSGLLGPYIGESIPTNGQISLGNFRGSYSSKGYFGGGHPNNYLNIITQLNFRTETTANLGNLLPTSRYRAAGINSSSNGYIGGGTDNSPNTLGSIDRYNFSQETGTIHGSSLSRARTELTGVNSTENGYFAGGSLATQFFTVTGLINKLIFSSGVTSELNISIAARWLLTGANSLTFGYFAGGDPFGAGVSNEIDKISFAATEVYTNISASLSIARRTPTGLNSSLKAYFAGGGDAAEGVYYSNIDVLTFSTETSSSLASGLTIARSSAANSNVNTSSKGYIGGGYTDNYGPFNTIVALTFSNETNKILSATLSQDPYESATGIQSGSL